MNTLESFWLLRMLLGLDIVWGSANSDPLLVTDPEN